MDRRNFIKTALIATTAVAVAGVGVTKVVSANSTQGVSNMSDKKVLVAYYSWSGNTKAVAEKIAATTNATMFEIQPKTPYSKDYNTVINQVQEEKNKGFIPEIVSNGDIKDYDIIFIGTPVWWYTASDPVQTFIKNNDFSGKTIVPFCTHGGGGASNTYTAMQKLAPNAKFVEGFTSYEKTATKTEIQKWINGLNL